MSIVQAISLLRTPVPSSPQAETRPQVESLATNQDLRDLSTIQNISVGRHTACEWYELCSRLTFASTDRACTSGALTGATMINRTLLSEQKYP